MKRILYLYSLIYLLQYQSLAQLPNGSIAPDFTVTDINGNSHNLYSYLNAGKTVYLDFFATWCNPCWVYHNSHALQNIWTTYGPGGTNEAVVIAIEGSPSTNLACIYGPSGCVGGTQGNWTTGVTYPIVHTNALNGSNNYNQGVYPTIYMICPSDKKIWQAGQQNATGLWNFRANKCVAGSTPMSITLVNKQNVKCINTPTGLIDISVQGGLSPYTFSWSNGTTLQDLVNVTAGTYTCTVTAQNGATVLAGPYTIENPPTELQATGAVLRPAGCNGVNSGEIEANPSGGWSSGYSYSWNTGATTKIVSNLGTGLYRCTVTDGNSCTKSVSITVQQAAPPNVQVTTSAAAITCTNPTVQLNASGSSSGSNPLSYQWSALAGNIVSGTNTATPTVNQAGAYQVTVTDNVTSCTASGITQVGSNLTTPACSVPGQMSITCGQPTVTITATVSNGTQYQWVASNGGAINGPTNQISCEATAAGTYTFTVTNAGSGCTASATAVVVNMGGLPTVSATGGVINCQNIIANLSATSNTSGVAYAWSGPNGFTSSEANTTTTVPGIYTVVVTAPNGCTSSSTATVTSNTTQLSVSLTASSSIINCNIPSVTVSSTVSPSANYTYQWMLNGQNVGSNANLTVTQGGTYTLVAVDAGTGCSATAQTSISAFTDVVASASVTSQIACFGNNTGSANCNASGGAGNYQYLWNTGATTPAISGLAPGTYTVVCTDAQGCTGSATVTIAQPTSALSASASATSVTMAGVNDGTATVTATGGTSPYTYVWSNGQTTATITGLDAGNYSVIVTDANGCTTQATTTVQGVNCALTGSVNTTPVTCFGGSNGSATVVVQNGTAPYSYQFSSGLGSSLPAGNYTVTATDANGCAIALSFNITQPPALTVQGISGTNPQCANEASGTATLGAISGGTSPYATKWSNGATGTTISNLLPGQYQATITDANGCTIASNPVIITADDLTAPSIACPANMMVCVGESVVTYADPIVTDNCAVNTSALVRTAGPASGQTFAVGATTVSYTYTDAGQNSASCSFVVNVTPALVLTSSSVQNGVIGVSPGTVTVSITGGTAPYTYQWTNANGQVVSDAQNLSTTGAGNYTLMVTDANGCSQTFPPFTVSMTISAEEPAWMSGVQISPNPTHNELRINWQEPADMSVTVLDLNGRAVQQLSVKSSQQVVFQLGEMPEGIYLIRLQHGQEIGFRKVVKQ